jgi:chromatin remodeling complex protein RSC6
MSFDNETEMTKTDRESQFEALFESLSTMKKQIGLIQAQITQLERSVNKDIKTLRKVADKNKSKGNRKPSGFAKSSKISESLCNFMNKPVGTEMARTEVTKFIIGYIKDKGLQQEDNKKCIKPDESLRNLLGVKSEDEVTYFNIQKFMNKHFIQTTQPSSETSATQ